MGLFKSVYKFCRKFMSLTKGDGKFKCVITKGFLTGKSEALAKLEDQLRAEIPDAQTDIDTVKFKKL